MQYDIVFVHSLSELSEFYIHVEVMTWISFSFGFFLLTWNGIICIW